MSSARVYDVLPPDEGSSHRDRRAGGLELNANPDQFLAGLVSEGLSPSCVLVVEDELRRLGDRSLDTMPWSTTHMGGTVLHLVPATDAVDSSALVEVIRRGTAGYPGNVFLIETHKDVSSDALLHGQTKLVAAASFDAETWTVALPD